VKKSPKRCRTRFDWGHAAVAIALVGTSSVTACVGETPSRSQPRRDVAVWEFPPEKAPGAVHLWPADNGAPERDKRQMTTARDGERLSAIVEGSDPYFVWKLKEPMAAHVFSVDLDSDGAGTLQLFHTSSACPIFSEACSSIRGVVRGESLVEFLLDPADPVRELRLDPPGTTGAHVGFSSIAVSTGASLAAPWKPVSNQCTAETTSFGLRCDAIGNDPGLGVATPGLNAHDVTAIELVMREGPNHGAPQLFWDGTCGNFSEACSVRLAPADAGDLTHRANLKRAPRWTGAISNLRLDPGDAAGAYVIERISLVNDPRD